MPSSFKDNNTKTQNIENIDRSSLSALKRGKRTARRPATSPLSPDLQVARDKYQYNYSHIAPVAMVDKLPKEEIPSLEWWTKVIQVMILIFVNAKMSKRLHWNENQARRNVALLFRQELVETFWEGDFKTRLQLIWHLLKAVPQFLWKSTTLDISDWQTLVLSLISQVEQASDREQNILLALHEGVKERVDYERHFQTATSLEEYNQQFVSIDLPAIAAHFQEDECFAYLRVAGPNPTIIERVQSCGGDVLSQKFPVTNAQYQAVMGSDDSLAQAVAENRLYVADYAILSGAINGTYPNTHQKYIEAPQALFAVPPVGSASQNLRPIAIQCSQEPGPQSPIFTPAGNDPSERYAWSMAKAVVQVADSNYHEAVAHLGRTHLFISPFVMATHRQLLPTHPLSILLRPHFEGTLNINNGAQSRLMAPKGGVDTNLAATIDCARALTVAGLQTYGFNSAMLPKQLEQRGVADSNALPLYPYRDDALLLWEAIHDWAKAYLSLYYTNDAAVQQDIDLQNWVAELLAFDGGRVVDFGEAGQIQTLSYLIDAVTLIIFTASAQHAAVNFPQGDIMTYAPAMPLAAYAPAPSHSDQTEDEYFELLPPLHQAQGQLELCYLLGQVYHTVLGQYDAQWFVDDRVQSPLQVFQNRLQKIEGAIALRNQTRLYPYPYLQPSKIPQSINI
jgi:arachidonate 15-lipoxygenase